MSHASCLLSSRVLCPLPHLSSISPHCWCPRAGRFIQSRSVSPGRRASDVQLSRGLHTAAPLSSGPFPAPPGPRADPGPLPPQSLLLLGLVAAVGLGLNLVLLTAYLVCACCCRQDDAAQTKRPRSCCVTWTAVVAALICW